jgi:hypothetical protein
MGGVHAVSRPCRVDFFLRVALSIAVHRRVFSRVFLEFYSTDSSLLDSTLGIGHGLSNQMSF